jgi:hypothetical protein
MLKLLGLVLVLSSSAQAEFMPRAYLRQSICGHASAQALPVNRYLGTWKFRKSFGLTVAEGTATITAGPNGSLDAVYAAQAPVVTTFRERTQMCRIQTPTGGRYEVEEIQISPTYFDVGIIYTGISGWDRYAVYMTMERLQAHAIPFVSQTGGSLLIDNTQVEPSALVPLFYEQIHLGVFR